jgi:hypothetical protein
MRPSRFRLLRLPIMNALRPCLANARDEVSYAVLRSTLRKLVILSAGGGSRHDPLGSQNFKTVCSVARSARSDAFWRLLARVQQTRGKNERLENRWKALGPCQWPASEFETSLRPTRPIARLPRLSVSDLRT